MAESLAKIYLEEKKKKKKKNATFYVDCFLYWLDLILFPIHYFILSRDKQ